MAAKYYTEEQLTKALMLVLEQNMSMKEAARITGINKRTIQRYKVRHLEDGTPEPFSRTDMVLAGETTISSKRAMDDVDDTLIRRARFLSDVMDTKQVVIDRIRKIARKSQNLDALQRTVKTLDDLENRVDPDGAASKLPAANANLNVFNFFNQKLTNEGYEGPELTDADIVTND